MVGKLIVKIELDGKALGMQTGRISLSGFPKVYSTGSRLQFNSTEELKYLRVIFAQSG